MKILTFSTLFPNAARPTHGIPVENRLRQLVASGCVEAEVIAPVPWFPMTNSIFGEYAAHARAPREERRFGIQVAHPRYVVLPRIGMTAAPLFLARAAVPAVERLLRRFPFQLIDAHYFYPDGVAAVMLGRRFGKPVTITARGTDINVIPRYRVPRAMIMWAARHAAGIISVSRALKDRMSRELGVPPERIEVLRNGVDLEFFKPVERARVRGELGYTRRTLLSVGNLLPLKGHDLVIRALQSLPDCDLVIAGGGPERAALEALGRATGVAETGRFAGVLQPTDLRRHYGAADALILASSREGWANVLLEAMACGAPVCATAVGGTPEIITAPEAGVLIDERTPDGVARGVRRLFANHPGRAATRAYAERFSWDCTTRGQLDLFSRILSAGPQPGSSPVFRASGET